MLHIKFFETLNIINVINAEKVTHMILNQQDLETILKCTILLRMLWIFTKFNFP